MKSVKKDTSYARHSSLCSSGWPISFLPVPWPYGRQCECSAANAHVMPMALRHCTRGPTWDMKLMIETISAFLTMMSVSHA